MATISHDIIGLMSGTSLDGLDIAHCRFERVGGKWHYRIMHAETIPYSPEWRERLEKLDAGTAMELAITDSEFGHLMGDLTRTFMAKYRIKADLVASHGQTIFHQPRLRWTTQIGKGACIAAETGIPVVCDFRSVDVALGGQGAPLVPIGDRMLFPEYRFCLNIGGFVNISFEEDGRRIAYDICPGNLVLNKLATLIGKEYDPQGEMARNGRLIPDLLESLNQLPYYLQPPPKSLGKEWVHQHIWPLFDTQTLYRETEIRNPEPEIRNLLHTFCEHIAIQVARNCGNNRLDKLLVTGGGALNKYLMERIRQHAAPEIFLPDLQTIQFKEALVFAFLGLLRWRNEANVLSSVTGAAKNSIGGAIYLG